MSTVLPGKLSPQLLHLVILDERRGDPLHLQLRQSLRGLISRHFQDQDLFFSEDTLVSELGISRGTVRRALGDLAGEGLLKRWPAKGTIVCKPETKVALKNVAVFLPDWSSRLIGEFLDQIGRRAAALGAQLVMCRTHKGERLSATHRRVHFSPAEGAVLLLSNPPEIVTEIYPVLTDLGYFVINIDTNLPSFPGHYVGVDNALGIRLALEHLISLGHAHITMIASEPEGGLNIMERIATFEHLCAEQGLSEARVHRCGTRWWEDSGEKAAQAIESLMRSEPRPTVVLATSDSGALSIIRWLTQHRIPVPEKLSVLGFDGETLGGRIHPALSTVSQPFAEIADSSFRLLAERSSSPRRIIHAPTLLLRESTGPVPKIPRNL